MPKEYLLPIHLSDKVAGFTGSVTLAGGAAATVIFRTAVEYGTFKRVKIRVKAYDAVANDHAYYEITGAIRNVAGTVTLVGTQSLIALESDASWVLVIAANNTTKELELTATPDATNATRFDFEVELS
jgi:hypothetical protein